MGGGGVAQTCIFDFACGDDTRKRRIDDEDGEHTHGLPHHEWWRVGVWGVLNGLRLKATGDPVRFEGALGLGSDTHMGDSVCSGKIGIGSRFGQCFLQLMIQDYYGYVARMETVCYLCLALSVALCEHGRVQ